MNDGELGTTALAELNILSSIIGRTESAIYGRHNWLFSLITALLVITLGDNPLLYKVQFLFISIGATVLFFITDLFQREVLLRAINRSKYIEEWLQGKLTDPYVGPKISESLDDKESFFSAVKNLWKDRREIILKRRVLSPYLIIIIVVLVFVFS